MRYLLARLKQNNNWPLLVIIVFGFVLRLFNLGKHDFWFDEVLTHEIISGRFIGPFQEFNTLFIDKHPPFYYALLNQWSFFFGLDEYSLRFFSVIFSVLSIIFIYKLGVLLFDKIAALIGAAFMALSPFQIWYAQEARMFSLSVFLAVIDVYFFFKALEKNKRKIYWVIYSLVTLCFISTTYFAFFLFIPKLIIILSAYKKYFMKWLLAVSLALLIFALTILPIFITQFDSLQHGFWLRGEDSMGIILITLVNFIIGYHIAPVAYWWVLFLMVGLVLFSLINREKSKTVLFSISLCIVPLISVFLFGRYFAHIYIIRHAIIFSPFLYLSLSKGITSIKHSSVKLAVVVSILIILSFSLFNYYVDKIPFNYKLQPVYIKKPVRSFVTNFLRNKKDGDAVGFANFGFMMVFQHYLDKEERGSSGVPNFYFYKKHKDPYFELILSRMHAQKFTLKCQDVNIDTFNSNKYNLRNIWVFFTSWSRDGSLTPNDQEVKRWFDKHFPKLREYYFDGVWVGLYQIQSDYNEE